MSKGKGVRIDGKTILIVGLAIGLILVLFGFVSYQNGHVNLNTNPTPSPSPTSTPQPNGALPVTISCPFFMFNSTSVGAGASDPVVVALHIDGTFIGANSASANTITGSLNAADNGQFWLLARAQSTVYGLVESVTAQQGVIVPGSQTLMTYQGQVYTAWKINAGTPISTGYSVTVNIIGFTQATVPTLVSYLNATGVTNTAYSTCYTTVYISGTSFAYGQGVKVARVQITLGSTGNVSAYDSGNLQLKSITVNWGNGQGQITYTNVGPLNGAGTSSGYVEVNLGLSQTNQAATAQPWLYGQADSATGLSITFNWNAKLTGASDVFIPTAKVYLLDPTSTSSTATHTMEISTS
jgi:hypothetical protein